LSGVSDSRILTLQGSDLVRQKLPKKLRDLQQSLWKDADIDTVNGKGTGNFDVLCTSKSFG